MGLIDDDDFPSAFPTGLVPNRAFIEITVEHFPPDTRLWKANLIAHEMILVQRSDDDHVCTNAWVPSEYGIRSPGAARSFT